ncbi:sulfatase-like hydrolase/transferase [Sinomicrobium soli]|uniref:sulfatase-like hydrolase/transferase n=1 Tax=Sinomicrobium sp. N-1-3-6 TaxID=2219864 RepID=UPI001374F8B1|nr:sulfatase-like hydrolase/transferase [Sinomicrobium sp. N-1-3-6]
MKYILWITVFLGMFSGAYAQDPPNVILILVDDMGIGDVSSVNGGLNRTPALDALKDGGIWCNAAYSGSAVCAPARASLLTGKYPHRTGVVSLSMATEPWFTSLKTSEVTMADVFRANNYKTALVGKWHLGMLPPFHPLKRGFDESYHFVGPDLKTYYNFTLDENGNRKKYKNEYLDDVLTEHAVNFIKSNKETPFFMHLAYSAPHRPLGGPRELVNHYLEKGFDDKTAKVYAMIEAMDKGLQKLVNTLEELGISENTLVIFASDNGQDPGAGTRFNMDQKGKKYTVYEGGIHIPLLFYWPGHFAPGQVDDVVHFTDIFPTLVDICGLKAAGRVKKDFDGVSLSAILQGTSGSKLPEARFWQWNRHKPFYSHNAAVRLGDWKLVRPFKDLDHITGESGLKPLLYHIREDASESGDLSAKYPGKVRQMLKMLEKWSARVEKDRLKNTDFKDEKLINM